MKISIDEIIDNTGELLIMPFIASKVIGLVSQTGTTAQELSKILIADQAITTKLLRMVNSPFYGVCKKVTKISEAIVLLGFDAVKSLVLTVSIKNICRSPDINEKLMWEHSIGVAVSAAYLAKQLGIVKYEELFIAGLLHDVGRVPIYKSLLKEYNQLLYELDDYSKVCDYEKERFGFTHAEVGGKIINKWNLPEVLEEITTYHHSFPDTIPENIKNKKVIAIVSLANKICWKLSIGFNKTMEIEFEAQPEFEILSLPPDFFKENITNIRQVYREQKNLFED